MKRYYIKSGLVRGFISVSADGYRYMPFDSAHRTSRKAHDTPEDAVKGRIRGGRIIQANDIAQAEIIAKGGNPV